MILVGVVLTVEVGTALAQKGRRLEYYMLW
jgi:hypothetical protein